MRHGDWFLEIPFDILDAAVYECLPGYGSGWVDFERQELTSGSVIYRISQWQLGELGSIIIRKSSSNNSVLQIYSPTRPKPRPINKEEWSKQGLSGRQSRQERLEKELELLKKIQTETEEVYRRKKEHHSKVVQVLFQRMSNDLAVEEYFKDKNISQEIKLESTDFVAEALAKLEIFQSFIERQAHHDVFQKGKPQESIARGLLQAFLTDRSYREVPVRGGQTDILVNVDDGRILYEIKIWRGKEYFSQGLREIEEYVKGENDDGKLKSIFYVVFDPSKNKQASLYYSKAELPNTILSVPIYVSIIDLTPKKPSKA